MRKIAAALLTLLPLAAAAAATAPYDETVEKRLQPQIESLLGQLVKEGRNLSLDGVPVHIGGRSRCSIVITTNSRGTSARLAG